MYVETEVFDAIHDEIARAKIKHPGNFNSTHEGFAVLKEEFDELWDDVKADKDGETMKKEAIQVAAMAIRFIQELC
jgi:hypothetical protein